MAVIGMKIFAIIYMYLQCDGLDYWCSFFIYRGRKYIVTYLNRTVFYNLSKLYRKCM